jgi:membrane protein DedA with SNARE-associated domain
MLQDLNEKVREPLMRRGTLFVLFYHFAGYTRVIGPTSAGLMRMDYRKWAMADYTGAVLWICAYFSLGYLLGVLGISLDSTDEWFRYVEWGLVILFGIWAYYLINAHTNFFSGDKKDGEEEDATKITNIP